MGRLAAFMILVSQLLLLWVVFEPSGRTAIWFTFAGHPLLVAGIALGLWVLTRRLRSEKGERTEF
jgi:uncharacterized membrane protein YqjE